MITIQFGFHIAAAHVVPESPITVSQVNQPPSPRQQSVAKCMPPAEPLLPGGLKDIATALLVFTFCYI